MAWGKISFPQGATLQHGTCSCVVCGSVALERKADLVKKALNDGNWREADIRQIGDVGATNRHSSQVTSATRQARLFVNCRGRREVSLA
jgi:hypothetical protein